MTTTKGTGTGNYFGSLATGESFNILKTAGEWAVTLFEGMTPVSTFTEDTLRDAKAVLSALEAIDPQAAARLGTARTAAYGL